VCLPGGQAACVSRQYRLPAVLRPRRLRVESGQRWPGLSSRRVCLHPRGHATLSERDILERHLRDMLRP
jgi:hypothetical protein